MNIRCWNEIEKYGVNDVLNREYGSLIKKEPEPEYNISLEIDLERVPSEGGTSPPTHSSHLLNAGRLS